MFVPGSSRRPCSDYFYYMDPMSTPFATSLKFESDPFPSSIFTCSDLYAACFISTYASSKSQTSAFTSLHSPVSHHPISPDISALSARGYPRAIIEVHTKTYLCTEMWWEIYGRRGNKRWPCVGRVGRFQHFGLFYCATLGGDGIVSIMHIILADDERAAKAACVKAVLHVWYTNPNCTHLKQAWQQKAACAASPSPSLTPAPACVVALKSLPPLPRPPSPALGMRE
ncbi:hypothetical protein K439DRAFT_1565123 [Ramaria rubella]|nr:hypothetical protein K439DRAFT_1565123 [Ramaria rubella]